MTKCALPGCATGDAGDHSAVWCHDPPLPCFVPWVQRGHIWDLLPPPLFLPLSVGLSLSLFSALSFLLCFLCLSGSLTCLSLLSPCSLFLTLTCPPSPLLPLPCLLPGAWIHGSLSVAVHGGVHHGRGSTLVKDLSLQMRNGKKPFLRRNFSMGNPQPKTCRLWTAAWRMPWELRAPPCWPGQSAVCFSVVKEEENIVSFLLITRHLGWCSC